ncbi:hypothetical protein CCP3SC1AL1_470010 [Gammaproteobacteria bacterium]
MINHGKMDNGPLHPDGHALVKLASEVNRLTDRITALEAQVAAADRLADELATALEACRPKSHHAACPQPEYPLSRCMCGCDQPALAAFRAAKGE